MLRFFSNQKDIDDKIDSDWDDLLLNSKPPEITESINSKSFRFKLLIPLTGLVLALALINVGEYVSGRLLFNPNFSWLNGVKSINLSFGLPRLPLSEKTKTLVSTISSPLALFEESKMKSSSLNQTIWNSVKTGEATVRQGVISSVVLFDSFFLNTTVNIKANSNFILYRAKNGLALSLIPAKSWFSRSWLVISDWLSWLRLKFGDLSYSTGYYWDRLIDNWQSFIRRESKANELIDVESLRQSLKMEILAEIERELGELLLSGGEPKPIMIDQGEGQGLVVVPLTEDSDNQKIKTEIEKMFSDPVNIRFDADDQSGVITPIFRDSTGGNYIFILTPIKNR